MVSKRLIREAGHRRKFLAIVDETPNRFGIRACSLETSQARCRSAALISTSLMIPRRAVETRPRTTAPLP